MLIVDPTLDPVRGRFDLLLNAVQPVPACWQARPNRWCRAVRPAYRDIRKPLAPTSPYRPCVTSSGPDMAAQGCRRAASIKIHASKSAEILGIHIIYIAASWPLAL